jgi:alpha-2-macroglobulin
MDRFLIRSKLLWLKNFLHAVVGDLRWSPPSWARRVGDATTRFTAVVEANPRRSAGYLASCLAVLVAAVLGWRWYQSQPKPVEYSVSVTAPERTCIECNPPGKPHAAVLGFSGSVAPLELAGKVIDPAKSGVSIRPEIPGEWRWQDDRTLVFTPSADWPLGKTYTVQLARRGFAAPQLRLDRYSVEFSSPVFAASIESNEFHQDPVVAADKKVVTTLRFTQPVDVESLEKRISVKLLQKVTDSREEEISPAPAYTLTYDKLRLHAYLHTSSLSVLPKGGRVAIEVKDGVRATGGSNATPEKLVDSVAVPGLYSLVVNELHPTIARNERDVPSQALVLETSHSVAEPEITGHVRAWLLPAEHPDPKLQDQQSSNRRRPFNWSVALVTPEILEKAEAVELSYVPNERDHVELHSFGFSAKPGRQFYVQVDKGLKSFGGYLMADAAGRVLTVPEYPKEVHISSQGALLALSGPKKLVYVTRDVPAVRVQVGRLLPDQLQHLITQSGGTLSQPAFTRYGFDQNNLTERFTDVVNLPELAPGAANYQTLDLGRYLEKPGAGRQGVFLLRIEAWDPERKQVIYAGQGGTTVDTRLIVVTDIGMVAKRSVDGTQDVFLQSIATGEPMRGVTVQIVARNGQPVLTEISDGDGHVRFADTRTFREEREPVLYLARRDGDSAFLPIRSQVNDLDLSRFDVGGVSNRAEQAALTAYLFSDRGIYRPGDEIRTAAIVKTLDWRRLAEGLPLRVVITDPRGQVVKRELMRFGSAGFEEIRYQTRAAGTVGNYTISLYLVRQDRGDAMIGTLDVKVQEFLPDRLRMTTHFSKEQAAGWVTPDDLKAEIALENLFGTPAAGRRVRASMRLSPAAIAFEPLRDWQFRDPQAAKEGFSENLMDLKTSDEGHASFDLNLQRFARATYRVNLDVEGYEADGGRGVSGEATQLVSSLPFLVGWKADGRLDFIARGSARNVSFIAVDSKLARTAAPGLLLKRLERRYISVLLKQDNGVFKYESRLKEAPLDERPLALPGGSATVAVDAGTPGDFSYLVTDASGQVYARIDYTIAGAANLSRSMEKNAELQIVLDKQDYAPGSTIRMQIQAPYTGTGLITIERDHVYAWRWFRTTTNSSVQEIQVPQGLEGNGYVSVSFVRDPASDEIYTSPLSFGVRPFSIALDARRNAVTLRAPAQVKPGEELAIAYKTARPARLALFAVDEGILQVARYRTPDPLSHFFRKRSLDVSTRQILDLILPGFRESMLSAPGGDEGALLGANLNPFKRKTDAPVAYWAGIVDAGPDERTLKWKVPDYFNGRVRIMAVAVSEAAIGAAERTTLVRGDFVLSPNAPLTAAPGDEFEVSVGVANNIESSGADAAVEVSLSGSPELQVLGESRQTLKIGALRESSARFRVRALDVLGSGSLQFRAALGNRSAQQTATVSVRPGVAYMTTLAAGSFKGSARVSLSRNMYSQFRTLDASISSLPLALAHGLSSYLDHYPYSCTEQIVSQAMPAIVLSRRPEFGEIKARRDATLATLVDELRSRQNPDGSFRYWAGGVETHEFVSVYTLHVLLEASDGGLPVPGDMLLSGRQFLLDMARRDGNNIADERVSAYALYLLARQGTVVGNEAAALQRRLQERYAREWPSDIVAAYLAAAYRLMQQQSLADRTIAEVTFGNAPSPGRWHGAMSRDGDLLYLLSKHFPQRLARLPATVLDDLVKHVQAHDYNSLAAATTILALDAYATASASNGGQKLSMEATLADKSRRALPLPAGLFPKVAFPATTQSLTFGSEGDLRAFYLVNESGFDRAPSTTAITQSLEVTRDFLGADGKPATKVKLGDEVTVRVRFRAIGRSSIDDTVLVDLLPGGFDLVIPNTVPADQPFLSAITGPRPFTGGREGRVRVAGCLCQWLATRPDGFPDFADLREDRVVIYGRATDSIQEYSYRIKATNAGDFLIPGAFGASMYDATVRARSAAGRMSVER